MSFQIRKLKILERLDANGSADVAELADLLRTSEITVRRDLAALAGQGLLVRTHGGAMKTGLERQPVQFAKKATSHAEAKAQIAARAAGLIHDGDTLFLDCGSTVFQLCPLIRSKKIRVITNSLPIVRELLGSAVTLNLIGGELDAARQAAHGLVAEEHVARYRADAAFIGVDGFSLETGLTARTEVEAAHTRALLRQADRVVLLCDSSKLQRDQYVRFAPAAAVHTLVTDAQADPEVLERYRAAGVEVLVAAVV
jgi:DeoR family fructose operon transcriptional repressor